MDDPSTSIPDFKSFFQAARDLYLVIAPYAPYTIVAASDAYLLATMTKRDDIIGHGLFEIFPANPSDPGATGVQNLASASFERVIRNRTQDALEVKKYDIPRPAEKGGGFEERWWSVVNSPVFGPNSELINIILRVDDVTKFVDLRLSSELHLQAVEELRAIISISADAIIFIDEDQRITSFNEGAERILGYSKAETIGQPLDILIPERFRTVHRQHVDRFATGDVAARRMGQRDIPIIGRRKNGEEFPAEAAISKIEMHGKKLLTVALRDISHSKRTEQEQRILAEVGAILSSTLDYEETLARITQLVVPRLADWCIIDLIDEDGQVRRLKVACADPAKASIAELLERTPVDRKKPNLSRQTFETRQPILMRDISQELLASFGHSREHQCALCATEIKSALGVPVIAAGELRGAIIFASSNPAHLYGPRDLQLADEIAYRAALAIENARLYGVARRAVEARDGVLSIVAHDLRNPLSAISLHLELLRRQGLEAERRSQKPLDAIVRATTRMKRIINDLLDVSSLEAGGLSIACDRACVKQVIIEAVESQTLLSSAASVDLRLDVPEELPEIWLDRDRILQVFENLIGNAIKFTKPGGCITVGAQPEDGEVRFWVADTGTGIPSEHLPHLFERFWQANKANRQGTGLGLSIVKGIVEAHDGHIWVQSTPGSGSTFNFTLPRICRAALQFQPGA